MAPPKVRFLTKIYHPNIGTCASISEDPRATHAHYKFLQTNSGESAWTFSKVRRRRRRTPSSMLTFAHRQVVARAADQDGAVVGAGTSELAEPGRSAGNGCSEALQGGREGCAACEPGVDREVCVWLEACRREALYARIGCRVDALPRAVLLQVCTYTRCRRAMPMDCHDT